LGAGLSDSIPAVPASQRSKSFGCKMTGIRSCTLTAVSLALMQRDNFAPSQSIGKTYYAHSVAALSVMQAKAAIPKLKRRLEELLDLIMKPEGTFYWVMFKR
jgi:hypothetical protein